MKPVSEKFIVVTEFGSVLVSVNPAAENGLDNELLLLEQVGPAEREQAEFETPLRAFAAKMVDIITQGGFDGGEVSCTMREMLVREKATSELGRIERWSRANA